FEPWCAGSSPSGHRWHRLPPRPTLRDRVEASLLTSGSTLMAEKQQGPAATSGPGSGHTTLRMHTTKPPYSALDLAAALSNGKSVRLPSGTCGKGAGHGAGGP